MGNERLRDYEQRLKDAEDLRISNSYVVFLGWLVVEVAVALISIRMADNTPRDCTGQWLCGSRRDNLGLVAMALGAPVLLGQFALGMLLTAYLNRQDYHFFAAGSIAFFTTAVGAALIVAKLFGL